MTNYQETAVSLYQNGYNCAQAVVGAFCEQFGMDKDTAYKIASPFGGGIGGSGDLCGAAAGAILLISMKYGYSDAFNADAKAKQNEVVQSFLEYFKNDNCSLYCREIFVEDEDKEIKCPKAVASAVKFIEDNLL